MPVSPIFWIVFAVVVLGMIAIDLGIFTRKSHTVSFREALTWTGVWATLATCFGIWIWNSQGQTKGLEFFNGYLIELSLSADNVFIFALIFRNFGVPPQYQHKVLIWGVLSALVMRFILIGIGVQLINQFHWILYIFGAFLLYTGVKMLWSRSDEEEDPSDNPVVRYARRVLPLTPTWVGDRFLVKENGKRLFTPLFIVLICIEISDLIFAVDSIPAVFGITQDQFIIFTSNVFAIMGLRSLYFVLSGVIDKFHYLKPGLGLILAFVGVKMLLGHTDYKIGNEFSLAFTIIVLLASIIGSMVFPKATSGSGNKSGPEA
ncbi:MAG: TerC family protein [Verrucomicrobiota bacterium]